MGGNKIQNFRLVINHGNDGEWVGLWCGLLQVISSLSCFLSKDPNTILLMVYFRALGVSFNMRKQNSLVNNSRRPSYRVQYHLYKK